MKKTLVAIISSFFVGASGCALKSASVMKNPEIDGKYDYSKQLISYAKQDYEKIRKSVYCIKNVTTYEYRYKDPKDPEKEKIQRSEEAAWGTGFVYSQKNGYYYLITNYHVANMPEYTPKGKKVKAMWYIVDNIYDQNTKDDIPLEYVGGKNDMDVAILKTKHPLNVYPYAIGDSSELKEGHVVFVEGYPLGETKATVDGIVSNMNPRKFEMGGGITTNYDILLDVSVNPGNSGSPVFALRDGRFEWVGLVHASYYAEGMKLAIKINEIKKFLKKVEKLEAKQGKKLDKKPF